MDMRRKVKKYEVYGPVQKDMVWDYWQVILGEKVIGTFLLKKEAVKYAKLRNSNTN